MPRNFQFPAVADELALVGGRKEQQRPNGKARRAAEAKARRARKRARKWGKKA